MLSSDQTKSMRDFVIIVFPVFFFFFCVYLYIHLFFGLIFPRDIFTILIGHLNDVDFGFKVRQPIENPFDIAK